MAGSNYNIGMRLESDRAAISELKQCIVLHQLTSSDSCV
jgi:hypothetical protein